MSNIDKDMRKLIKEMNKLGLRTTQCCAGHDKRLAYVSILMDNIEDVAIRQKGKRLVIWWHRRKQRKSSYTPMLE